MTGHFAVGERVRYERRTWVIGAYDGRRVLLESDGEAVWVRPFYLAGYAR